MTDNFGNENDPVPSSMEEQDTTTPSAVRHEPASRAKSENPAMNETTAPAPVEETAAPLTNQRPSLVHELRDGTRYVDYATAAEEASPPVKQRTTPAQKEPPSARRANGPAKRGPSLVHELRDGTKYVDDGREHTGGVVHELRDGTNYVDE